MAVISTKTTFSLDLETAGALQRLADAWRTSKSDVVRRLAREADAQLRLHQTKAEKDLVPVSTEAAGRLAALRSLQSSAQGRGVDFQAWKTSIQNARR